MSKYELFSFSQPDTDREVAADYRRESFLGRAATGVTLFAGIIGDADVLKMIIYDGIDRVNIPMAIGAAAATITGLVSAHNMRSNKDRG